MKRVGIMQGRLSPAQDGRLQFFPQNWQAEFAAAKKIGFDFIEWFADYQTDGSSSIGLWTCDTARRQIEAASEKVPVLSADCGQLGLFDFQNQLLKDFIAAAAGHIRVFCVPLLEESSISNGRHRTAIVRNLWSLLDHLEYHGARIALETDLKASELLDLLDTVGSARVGICYDLGNCTSYGFDCPNEILDLAGWIFEVHIKDRKVGVTESLPLGSGDVDFRSCFAALREIGYAGDLTLQAWRGEDYLADAERQLTFVRSLLRSL
jgi:hexulose-6-phosphate isomerase